MPWLRQAVLLACCLATCGSANGQNYGMDGTLMVEATVSTKPPSIDLHWPARMDVVKYHIQARKPDGSESSFFLAGNTTGFHLPNVLIGGGYEFRMWALRVPGSVPLYAYGNVYSGIDLNLIETPRQVILVVESSLEPQLSMEIEQWITDVSNSGWVVDKLSVSGDASPPEIRSVIQSRATLWEPNTEGAVFLLGHVPVAYSGNISPDGHISHQGAWPCDGYYGDVTSVWKDSVLNNTGASRNENKNVPGDGKFDASEFTTSVKLMVGRVDFSRLPGLGISELELTRRYLRKNHAFRVHKLVVEKKAVIDDGFESLLPDAPSASARSAMAACVGITGCVRGNLTDNTRETPSLFGLGAGYANYDQIEGVCSSFSLSQDSPQVVVAMLFGSFFGDFDSVNNVMRTLLAADNCTLATFWNGHPQWQMHHLAMNLPLGYAARLTQNSKLLLPYNTGANARSIHVSLMGDPTICLFVGAPVRNLKLSGGRSLAWEADATPDLVGFSVYRGFSSTGPWTKLTDAPILETTYRDPQPLDGGRYLVKAIYREKSASGTFINASEGMASDASKEYVSLKLVQPAASELGLVPAVLRVERTGNGPALRVILFPPSGSAEEGADYIALSREVMISRNATFTEFNIIPVRDQKNEGTEQLVLELESGDGIEIDPDHSTVTVQIMDHPWQEWQKSCFPASVDIADLRPNSDPDRDGLDNLLEYALRTDPMSADNSPLHAIQLISNAHFSAEYVRATDRPGVSCRVECSQDLATWNENSGQAQETLTTLDDGFEVCHFTTPIAHEREFFRIKASAADGFVP